MKVVASALMLLSACGRIYFSREDTDAAASIDTIDSSSADAAVCTGPFMPPVPISATSTPSNEWGASLSADGLELYFGSDRSGDFEIYRATRNSRSDSFDVPTLVAELASGSEEDNPFVTIDGLELWFDRSGEIMRSTRTDRASPWQTPAPVTSLNSGDGDVGASLRDDLLAVYFATNRAPTAGNFDLYVATRATPSDAFGAPVALTALNDAGFNCCPHIAGRGSELLFTTSSIVPGNAIAVVALDAAGLPTGTVSVAPFDGAGEEVDAFETPDGTLRGYAYRPMQGTGDFDLYLMERACP